jgi:hypothetical protein
MPPSPVAAIADAATHESASSPVDQRSAGELRFVEIARETVAMDE